MVNNKFYLTFNSKFKFRIKSCLIKYWNTSIFCTFTNIYYHFLIYYYYLASGFGALRVAFHY